MTERRAIFERALRLDPDHTALLIIDMQRGFLDVGEAMEVPAARTIVPRIGQLLEGFRARQLPVAFSEFVYSERVPLLVGVLHPEHRPAPPGAVTGFGVPSSSCLDGTLSVHTVAELAPRPGELVVRKHWYDAFAGTALDGALRARGVTSLVVTGTMTDICVLATVIGAFSREYRVTVVEDGVATIWPDIQRATLDIIARAYARVVPAAAVAAELAAGRSPGEPLARREAPGVERGNAAETL
ncbi:MAG TPA: isochorismatase family cysteine hydrolase [Methylomirabilota bacterium]|nr:isochorismatase family cysteine hydrolase [Methylomirabilota bacterium]